MRLPLDWNKDFQDQLEQVIEAEHRYALASSFWTAIDAGDSIY